MILTYEGTDITEYVNVTKAICRDVSAGRADSLELEFDHAASWYEWNPQEDDVITVSINGYSTGKMFLNAILPEGDQFRIMATAMPSAARRKAWGTFRDMTLANIMRRCGSEIGMDARLYGVDGNLKYPFLIRENEGCAAFLNRLGRWEGLAIKATNGAMRAVSIEYAQSLNAVQSLYIDTAQDGALYTRQENKKLSTLTVITPYARVTASDKGATFGNSQVISTLPASDVITAGRWARGLLLMNNRQQERLNIKSEFNPSISALNRVDIDGTKTLQGEWIVDEVEHDIFNLKSEIQLVRCITTIR